MNRSQLFLKAPGCALLTLMFACAAIAGDKEQMEVAASNTISVFTANNVRHYELAQKAAGILVFPRITKGGAGVAERSEVVLFMTPEALRRFMNANVWTGGVDAEVAVASKGAGGIYNSETLKKPIIAFVFGEQGLIADVSLAGTKISRMPA